MDRLTKIKLARERAIKAHKLAQVKMAKRTLYDLPRFEKGDSIWLDTKNLNTLYKSQKLGPK